MTARSCYCNYSTFFKVFMFTSRPLRACTLTTKGSLKTISSRRTVHTQTGVDCEALDNVDFDISHVFIM